jgi:AcrR family transcriptional regulator
MTMATAPTPEAGSKPALILEAASRLFLEHGYGAVSMDMVARTANVSKATLYAHFRSKDELFAVMVAGECCCLHLGLNAPEMDRMDTADALREIGRRFVGLILSPKALAGYRVVMAESARFPELARAFYEAGPAPALELVSNVLAGWDRCGRLSIPDPGLAAEQFLGMLRTHFYLRLLLNLDAPPPQAEQNRLVDAAVGLMMRGYASPQAGAPETGDRAV